MIDFPISVIIALLTISIYAYLIKSDKAKKDLDPRTEYPQVALFKYYCMFILALATFISFGFIVGFVICGASIGIVFLFGIWMEKEYKKGVGCYD